MTATDILRRLLDERGVEWEGGKRSLRWRDRYGVMMQAFPLANGELGMGVWSCTPEQAIAATLGATDAKPTQEESSGTCHITDNGPWGYPYVCSACGASFDPDVNNGEFNHCPNCGRRIEQ